MSGFSCPCHPISKRQLVEYVMSARAVCSSSSGLRGLGPEGCRSSHSSRAQDRVRVRTGGRSAHTWTHTQAYSWTHTEAYTYHTDTGGGALDRVRVDLLPHAWFIQPAEFGLCPGLCRIVLPCLQHVTRQQLQACACRRMRMPSARMQSPPSVHTGPRFESSRCWRCRGCDVLFE